MTENKIAQQGGSSEPLTRSGERGRGSGIRLSARRRANKRLEQTLRVVK